MLLDRDGNLLCLAYNSILRSSSRAFGFIPTGSIHSLQTIESELKGEAKVGMTFRKIENLQIWSAFVAFSPTLYTLILTIFQCTKV